MLNQLTNRVEITTQNHGFAVRVDDLPRDLEPTHINLNDQTLEGMRHRSLPVFSVQYRSRKSLRRAARQRLSVRRVHETHGLIKDFVTSLT